MIGILFGLRLTFIHLFNLNSHLFDYIRSHNKNKQLKTFCINNPTEVVSTIQPKILQWKVEKTASLRFEVNSFLKFKNGFCFLMFRNILSSFSLNISYLTCLFYTSGS